MSIEQPLCIVSEEMSQIPHSETSSADSKSTEHWEQERLLLLSMLEKNQKLMQQSQQVWQKEREELESHHSAKEKNLEKKLNEALHENKLLKMNQPEGDSLRIELFRELEKVDYDAHMREGDLNNEIKTLKNQLHSLQASAAQNKNRVLEEKHYLQTQIEIERNDHKKIQADLQNSAEELNAKLEITSKELRIKKHELERYKNEYENTVKNMNAQKEETEVSWEPKDKTKFTESSKMAKLLKVKELAIAGQLQSLQQEKLNLENFYSEKIVCLEHENLKLRSSFEELSSSANKKEQLLLSEITRLRDSNGKIMEMSQQKISKLQENFEAKSNQLSLVHIQYQKREKWLSKQNTLHLENIARFEELQTKYHEKEQKESAATAVLRKEVEMLQKQLAEQREENSNLRTLYLNSKHGERRTITRVISSAQNLIMDISKQQKSLIKQESDFTNILRELEAQATEKEKLQAQQIYDLSLELVGARKELNDYKALHLETQLTARQEENTKLRQEIETARTSLIHYHKMIQELQEDQPCTNEAEIQMLNSENESLMHSLANMERFYKREVAKLQEMLEQKNYKIEQFTSKVDRSRINRSKKQLEEIASWQSRQATFTKTIRNLENKVKCLSVQEDARRALSAHESSLENEELLLLRKEVNEKEDWVNSMRAAFEDEKQCLENEIAKLQSIISSYSLEQESKINLLSSEYTFLRENRTELAKIIETANAKVNSGSRFLEEGDDEFNEEIENTYRSMYELTRNEINVLKEQIEQLQQQQDSELNSLRAERDRDIEGLRKVEHTLNKHIGAQQEEIDQLTIELTNEKQQHADELETLRTELQALRKVNAKRHDTMRQEKDTLAADFNKLIAILQHRHPDTLGIQDKLATIEKMVNEPSFDDINPETMDHDSNSNKNILREIGDLRTLETSREQALSKERETLVNISQKLHKSVTVVQDFAQAECETIAKDLEMALKKLKTTQAEKEYLKKQRDELVQTLSKARSLSKTDRTAVTRLIDQLKNSLNSKIK